MHRKAAMMSEPFFLENDTVVILITAPKGKQSFQRTQNYTPCVLLYNNTFVHPREKIVDVRKDKNTALFPRATHRKNKPCIRRRCTCYVCGCALACRLIWASSYTFRYQRGAPTMVTRGQVRHDLFFFASPSSWGRLPRLRLFTARRVRPSLALADLLSSTIE